MRVEEQEAIAVAVDDIKRALWDVVVPTRDAVVLVTALMALSVLAGTDPNILRPGLAP